MRIFLVGMPGSGKTTFGKILSKKLDLPFIDLDDVIVANEQTDINTIFKEKGETYFREVEQKMLHLACDKYPKAVISAGGGTPCFFDNIEVMNRNGITIYLEVPVKELFRRMTEYGRDERPLLKNVEADRLIHELTDKLSYREAFYKKAHGIIDGEKWAPEAMILKALDVINNRNQK